MQECLNRTQAHLWAVLTNGRQLRLLRDSNALATAAYVEFDLEAIFDGELFSDFVLLYRMLHASRFEVGQVREVAACGAAFTVAPGFDPAVMAASEDAAMPHLPGVATPTDVQGGLRAGGRWVKAFPASVLGPEWISALQGPFPMSAWWLPGASTAATREASWTRERAWSRSARRSATSQIPLLAEL